MSAATGPEQTSAVRERPAIKMFLTFIAPPGEPHFGQRTESKSIGDSRIGTLIRARKGARLPRGRGRAVGRRRPPAAGSRIAAVRSAGVIRAPSGGSLRVGHSRDM